MISSAKSVVLVEPHDGVESKKCYNSPIKNSKKGDTPKFKKELDNDAIGIISC